MFDPQTRHSLEMFSPAKVYDCNFIGKKQASQHSDDVELHAFPFDCVHVYKNMYKIGFIHTSLFREP